MGRPLLNIQGAPEVPGTLDYYCVRFAPAPTRPRLRRNLQLWALISDIARQVQDPGVAHAKWQWWRDELQRADARDAQHPLLHTAPGGEQDWPLLLQLCDLREEEMHAGPAPDWEIADARIMAPELLRARLMTQALGWPVQEALLQPAALFVGWCESLRALGAELRRQRSPLPGSWVAEYGLRGYSLRTWREAPRRADLLRDLGQRLARCEEPLRADLAHQLPPPLRIRVAAYRTVARMLARRQYPVLDEYLELTPLKLLWIAWRHR